MIYVLFHICLYLSLPLALFELWVTCIISFISRKLFLKANHFAFSFFSGHLIGCFRELAFIFLFIFKSVASRFFVGAGPAHNSFSCCGHFGLRLPPLSAFLPASGGSSVILFLLRVHWSRFSSIDSKIHSTFSEGDY